MSTKRHCYRINSALIAGLIMLAIPEYVAGNPQRSRARPGSATRTPLLYVAVVEPEDNELKSLRSRIEHSVLLGARQREYEVRSIMDVTQERLHLLHRLKTMALHYGFDISESRRGHRRKNYRLANILFVHVSGTVEFPEVRLDLRDAKTWQTKELKSVGGCGRRAEEVIYAAGQLAGLIMSKDRESDDIMARVRVESGRELAPDTYVVEPETEVVLDGCASQVINGEPLQWRWGQPECPGWSRFTTPAATPAGAANLPTRAPQRSNTEGQLHCLLPSAHLRNRKITVKPSRPGRYEIRMRVETRSGEHADKVIYLHVARQPVADAGDSEIYVIEPGQPKTVMLDHSHTVLGGADSIGPATYRWTLVEGPLEASIQCRGQNVGRRSKKLPWADAPQCSFRAIADHPGKYRFALEVEENGFSSQAQVSYLVARAPRIDLASNVAYATRRRPVELDASGSFDDLDSKPTFRWRIVAGPRRAGHVAARLSAPHRRKTTFVAQKLGIYVVELAVRTRRIVDDRTSWQTTREQMRIEVKRSPWLLFASQMAYDDYRNGEGFTAFTVGAIIRPHRGYDNWGLRISESLFRISLYEDDMRSSEELRRGGGFGVALSYTRDLFPVLESTMYSGAVAEFRGGRLDEYGGELGVHLALDIYRGWSLFWDGAAQFVSTRGDCAATPDCQERAFHPRWRLGFGFALRR
ncbi:MAG: hypothetical protein MJE77_26435 [Proteobacteria bacterium]|nr:hypothetical protein [Pseudomonadota bacterium]